MGGEDSSQIFLYLVNQSTRNIYINRRKSVSQTVRKFTNEADGVRKVSIPNYP
jgi:hypothetical protein